MDTNTADFRWKAARSFPIDSKSSGLLANHFLSTLRTYESYGAIVLPKTVFKDTITCKFCSNVWRERPYSINIKSKKHESKSIKKILRRNERNPDSLRPYERNFVKRFQNNSNKLVLTCPVCSKKSEWPLERQKPLPVITPVVTTEPTKKKKKRNKDRMCGLKMSLAAPRQKQEKQEDISEVTSPDITPIIINQDTTPKMATKSTAAKVPQKQNIPSSSYSSKPKVATTKLNEIQKKSKNRSNKPLNKNVLKNMISKSSIKSSLKDFLNSLP